MAAVSEAAKQHARGKARERMAALRADKERWQAYLDSSRESRKALKTKYRRQAGALPLAEHNAVRAERAAARKAVALSTKEALHCAHVSAWRRSKPGKAWSHRYRTDPEFNAREKVRARLRKVVADSDLQQHLASEAKSGRLPTKWSALLGYTLDQLIKHLQRTLPKGATWDDFIDGSLHIDHITPRSKFDLTRLDEVRRCWCLSNLRLLHAADNMRKGARVEFLL